MGQLVIEVPENINRVFQVDDSEFSSQLLHNLEEFEKKAKTEKKKVIIPPRRHNLKEDGAAVLGIWADREESAEEIARKIRDRNNGKI